MRHLTECISRRLTMLIVAIAAASTAWILLRTHHGVRLTSDSAAYLSAAENLAAGKGLIDFEGDELTWFPPGFSIVLAGFELVGIGAKDASRWLNAILFGLTIGVSGLWLKKVCRSGVVVLAGVLAVASSRILQYIVASLYPESLFLLLTIGSLMLVSEFCKRPGISRRAQRLLALAGLLAGLSAAVRYVGIVAIASSLLLILLRQPSRTSLRTRLQAATLFGLTASLPVLAVLGRNLVVAGRLLGDRLDHGSGHSMLDAVEIILGLHGPSQPSFAIGWIMLLAAAVICWAPSRQMARPPPRNRLGTKSSAPFAVFVVFYVAALVFTQPLNAGPVIARLWLPAAIALVFVGCDALDTAIGRSSLPDAPRDLTLRFLLAGTGAAVIVTLTAASYLSAQNTRDALSLDHPAGAAIRGIAESPLIERLHDHDTDRLYSNRPIGVYLLSHIQPVHRLPRGQSDKPLTDSECLDLLRAGAADADLPGYGTLQIAWFDELRQGDIKTYCDIPALAAESPELELVEDFGDGAIYRFDPSG